MKYRYTKYRFPICFIYFFKHLKHMHANTFHNFYSANKRNLKRLTSLIFFLCSYSNSYFCISYSRQCINQRHTFIQLFSFVFCSFQAFSPSTSLPLEKPYTAEIKESKCCCWWFSVTDKDHRSLHLCTDLDLLIQSWMPGQRQETYVEKNERMAVKLSLCLCATLTRQLALPL